MLYVMDSPPDLLGRLAVEIHGPRGGVGDRRVQNPDAVLLGAHANMTSIDIDLPIVTISAFYDYNALIAF